MEFKTLDDLVKLSFFLDHVKEVHDCYITCCKMMGIKCGFTDSMRNHINKFSARVNKEINKLNHKKGAK